MRQEKFYGLYWLRAIFSIAVVIWHLNGFNDSLIFNPDQINWHLFSYVDFINFHVLLLAVPTFIFISLFLFSNKEHTFYQLKNRIFKLFGLYIIWIFFYYVWKHGFEGINLLVPKSFFHFINLFFKGAYTIYYFFIVLIINLIVVFVFQKISNLILYLAFLFSILLLFSFPYLAIQFNISELSSYWNPFNFLPYCFAALIVVREFKFVLKNLNYLIIIFLAITIVLAFFEWKNLVNVFFFKSESYSFPAYSRLSLLFETLVLFLFSLKIKSLNNKIIEFLSKYSLALYLIQSFYFEISKSICVSLFQLSNNNLIIWFSIIITILLSYLQHLCYKNTF